MKVYSSELGVIKDTVASWSTHSGECQLSYHEDSQTAL